MLKIENYPPILNEVFSASEAERLWGLAPGTVRAALLRDVIRGRKSGGTWLVARATMEAHYDKIKENDMDAKEKIRKMYAEKVGGGPANAAQIWKGYGEMGQEPYGWWLKPFNENARWIGSSIKEVRELM